MTLTLQAGHVRDRGFTLLEVLVAFAIAMPAIILLLRVSAESLSGTSASAAVIEATSRAQSQLAALTPATIEPGDWRGESDGFAWRRHVAALASAPPVRPVRVRGPYADGVTLYAVSVEVSWAAGRGRRAVTLDSMRLGPAVPSRP